MTAPETRLAHGDITGAVIAAFYEVFNTLGFGYLESIYKSALCVELDRRGVQWEREKGVPIYYKGEAITVHRLDLLVEGCVIVEVKSGELLHPIAHAQLA